MFFLQPEMGIIYHDTVYKQMEKNVRTLSEEFFSRSPDTRAYIKSLVMTIPTSRVRLSDDYNNTELYNQASPNTKLNMEAYGLVPPNKILTTKK
jgi:hypothetical protein